MSVFYFFILKKKKITNISLKKKNEATHSWGEYLYMRQSLKGSFRAAVLIHDVWAGEHPAELTNGV